ncbi:MAG: alcohol dehydrogenase catalytic domain-containing protein [Clostridia bacterium]|nr:alcohol dehydrogenase catalytic domain-containing protein [Clostridia bacterium]
MDNWILKGVNTLVNEPSSVNITAPTQVKVKVSHLLLTDDDAMLYNGDVKTTYPRIIGKAAVGIVTEAGDNCYGLQKGSRVYFEPSRACGNCLSCKSGKPKDCSEVAIAGRDFDGFMRDFVVCEYGDVAALPDSVSDFHALCIETIGIAENIYDKLNLSAGQRVAVVGGSFTGNIIAQVLLYHKVIPIVIDNNAANLEAAQKCGISYAFEANDEFDENIRNATSGNLCDAAIYCAASRLPLSLIPRLVGDGKKVVLCASTTGNAVMDMHDIMEKNLTVFGVSNAYGYTDAVINMLVHKAVNIDVFEKEVLTEFNPAELLDEKSAFVTSPKRNIMTVLKMII